LALGFWLDNEFSIGARALRQISYPGGPKTLFAAGQLTKYKALADELLP
jgi:hypothetical protein